MYPSNSAQAEKWTSVSPWRVVDEETKEPIAGVRLKLQRVAKAGFEPVSMKTEEDVKDECETDADGVFTLEVRTDG